MKTKKIRARYKGKHLSMGYRKGCVYSLWLTDLELNFWDKVFNLWGMIFSFKKGFSFNTVMIGRVGNPARHPQGCPYSSMATFLENWTVIPDDAPTII